MGFRDRRPVAPKHSSIVAFWQSEIDVGKFPNMGAISCCMACGKWPDFEDDLDDLSPDEVRWDRAHLVDYAFSKSVDVQEYVLLCGACHKFMPSFEDRIGAVRWVQSHPSWHARVAQFIKWGAEEYTSSESMTEFTETKYDEYLERFETGRVST